MEFTKQEAQNIGNEIGVNWDEVDLEEFRIGIGIEMEHGSQYGEATNVINDDPVKAGRIALAHLLEIPSYYTLLTRMEATAKKQLTRLYKRLYKKFI